MFKKSHNEDRFYNLFIANAKIANEGAIMLKSLMGDLENLKGNFNKMKEKEQEGDRLVHDILNELNHSFITPLDREDIFAIAKEMDDILDYIETAVSRFAIFNIKELTQEANIQIDLIEKATKELITVMENLKNMSKPSFLNEKIIEINRIEEEGDIIHRKALMKLFDGTVPILDVIKWKELYDDLENTLDACEDVANLIEGVVTKNA
ncbi:MAG: DUF47 family protein [Bacillota bacterium]|nr:DUF47 family protein [Bacillota bacterium]